MDEDVEDSCRSCITASSFKGELKGEGQIVIIKVREPKRIGEAFEKELEKLTDILVNRYG
jgi:hypothetical protein